MFIPPIAIVVQLLCYTLLEGNSTGQLEKARKDTRTTTRRFCVA